MLAQKSKLSLILMLVGTFMLMNDSAFGQQTPSRRYQPARDAVAPPSVHVPPQKMQMLPKQLPGSTGTPSRVSSPAGTTQYTFSDQNAQPNSNRIAQTNPMVQQTSFQVDENGAPVVPEILRGNTNANPQSPASQFQPPETSNDHPALDDNSRKTPDDFASSMNQARGNLPRIAPDELASQSREIIAKMDELRRRTQDQKQAVNTPATTGQHGLESMRPSNPGAGEQANSSGQDLPGWSNATPTDSQRQPAERLAAERFAAIQADREDRTADDQEISASEFIGQVASSQPVTSAESSQQEDSAPMLVAKQQHDSSVASVTQLPNNPPAAQAVRDNQVRTASSEETTNQTNSMIQLNSPAIRVETFGPQTVGINKAAKYQVVVHNNSSTLADRILVGIDLPEWIDIENVNLTTGGKEITDGKNQARLVWSIDKIPGNSSQTITISAVPRRAEVFDIGVEWTLVPRVGKTAINVTEPRLEMSIAGPTEVLYGETALYHMTVRNPGTGEAEDVVVMLPEALGGERATLGNIEAGKEKNFQVELLARTAGELNLVANAVAEGNLATSAERELVVRRADLDIAIQGPGLKYAGSMAQYTVNISNSGDATANEIVSAVALPTGVTYVSGVEAVKLIEGGMRWPVGTLEPGQTRTYKINCQLDTSGDLQLEVGARGRGDLAASNACMTTVETVADLVLTVADPKGPLPTGEDTPYEIRIQNRGSKSAKDVKLVMQFSEGIEPKIASGLEYDIVPGQVLFSPIDQIDPGQETTVKVTAVAMQAGTHIFRAQLICEESDSREIAEGTTRFFGESAQPKGAIAKSPEAQPETGSNDFGTDFQR